jgi:hypothetical protein
LPNISFALNYYFGGSDVFGYHLVNILIHIAVAFTFFLLARTTLNLPVLAGRFQQSSEIACAAALLWAVHPLQTNAVTYIVQRMTSMATLFFLLTLLFYVWARVHDKIDTKKIFFFGVSALFGIMALLSKETSGMLPVIIIGYEFFFLRRTAETASNRQKVLLFCGGLLVFLVICWLFLGNDPLARILSSYSHREFTLGQRLLTETRIIFHYLTLLILPLPSRLNLAYDYQLSTGLLAPPQTLLAIFGILGHRPGAYLRAPHVYAVHVPHPGRGGLVLQVGTDQGQYSPGPAAGCRCRTFSLYLAAQLRLAEQHHHLVRCR